MGNEFLRRLRALERGAREDGRMTEAEFAAGVARYSAALVDEHPADGIPSVKDFETMLRQMPPWLSRIFAQSVGPMDLLL
ncbi:hypothetical protein [Sphingobium sp. UBA5915]|uniref:hypothetical protein n=1 Tax=Sphingobium sp. UBA5915 TaxID=1947530 RepID=UPI0025D2DA3B|nr:hypothetical protein [Sphingobium sp. UBA5915]